MAGAQWPQFLSYGPAHTLSSRVAKNGSFIFMNSKFYGPFRTEERRKWLKIHHAHLLQLQFSRHRSEIKNISPLEVSLFFLIFDKWSGTPPKCQRTEKRKISSICRDPRLFKNFTKCENVNSIKVKQTIYKK